ncbi:MAG TPA: ABC transporter permease [Bacteroidales bacterium]|nr:ABC transporter permease [Bacteroidales bacterium]
MLKYLVEKEFKQLFRNPIIPKFIFVFPFAMLLILPLAANFEVKELNMCVVDSNHSPYSQRLVHQATASGYFHLSKVANTYQEALASVNKYESDIILMIPPDFEQSLIREQEAKVMILPNAVNGVKGGLGSAYLASIVGDFNRDIRAELVPAGHSVQASGIDVSRIFKFNPKLKYKYFMVPAIMVMLLAMITGFLPAFNIVAEKEAGTIEQLNVTPASKFNLILAKLIPFWVIGFVVLNICFGVAWLFYSMLPVGSVLTIYLFALVFVLAFSGLGLVISNYASTVQQAVFIIFFCVITFIFMSGMYTPVDNMPQWAQYISDISPLKYFIQVMRLVYLKGSATAELVQPMFALICFAVVFNSWAILSYRKKN